MNVIPMLCAVDFVVLFGVDTSGWVNLDARVDTPVRARRDPATSQGFPSLVSVFAGDNLSLPCRKESGVAERPPLDRVETRPF